VLTRISPDTELPLVKSVLRTVKLGAIVFDAEQRVVLWNRWMEQHSGLPADLTLDKAFVDLFPGMAHGRIHVAIREALANNFPSLLSQTLNKAPFPLYSTATDAANGVRMQQAVQIMPIEVSDSPRHCLVQIADVSMAVMRERQMRKQALALVKLSYMDGLTGISNRRRFDERISEEFSRAKRSVSPLSLLMIDIDYFKNYNDQYGHKEGDQCLAQVAAALSDILRRPADLVARYGGEEFSAIMPDTDSTGAARLAEAMRARIEALAIEHSYSNIEKCITISIGASTQIPGRNSDVESLINAADRALYQAKRSGRNRVVANDALGVPELVSND
jgi:diguanylate cyclase (GGDEF)-like protein